MRDRREDVGVGMREDEDVEGKDVFVLARVQELPPVELWLVMGVCCC